MMSLPFGSFSNKHAGEAPSRWAALLVIVLSLGPAMLAQKSEHDKDDPRARVEYLEQKRGGKTGTPPGARMRALKEVDGMLQREGKAYWDSVSKASTSSSVESSGAVREATTIVPSASQWTSIGPQPTNPNPANTGGGAHFAGRVTALAVDPSNTNIVYLGGAQGGVWKSVNAGASWTALTDSQASLAIGSIAIDPTNSQIIYVGTGEENYGSDSYYGAGILKSTNGGSSWTRLGQAAFPNPIAGCSGDFLGCGGARIGAIAIQPGNSSHLLAATNTAFSNSAGLYWSADAGNTWTAVNGASSRPADSVVFLNSTTALVGMHTQGVFTCTGFTGTPSCVAANGTGANVITVSGTDRVSLGTDSTGTAVYAALAVASTSDLSGLYKSTDAGVNWTKLNSTPDFCTDQCFYDMLIAVNPTNGQDLFVGGSGFPNNNFLYRSLDGGASWTLATTNIHADQHAAAYTPDGTKMYIGNDGGVYSTSNTTSGTVVWTELNSTLNITQFYGYFGLHPTNSQITYGGTQDNGTQKFTGNLAWDGVTCGDGASAVVDVNTPSTVFANCQLVDIRRSTSGDPGSFGVQNNAGTGITDSSRVGFIPPMVGDTSNPMRLYFGTYRLWRAPSNGSSPTWTAITGDLTSGGSETITNIGITPDNNTAFVTTTAPQPPSSILARVSRVDNLSTTPAATTFTAPIPANTQINGIAAVSASVAYIAVPGFAAGSHVFKTTNGGSTWFNITSNLPNTPANDIVVDPDIAGTLYLATDVGVFISSNDGASWLTLKTGLPNVAVFGLKLHRPSRTLRAATHGRGMWDLAVPSCTIGPCLTLSPSSLNFGNQNVGTSSMPQSITLTSSGTQTLTISGISSSNPTEFSTTQNTCGGTLAASATCTVSVTFAPSNAFNRSGTVSVSSNAPSSPTAASLSGVGIVVPSNDNFANGKIIPALPYSDSSITNGATSETTDPVPPRSSTSCVDVDYDATPGFNHHSAWYFYTPAVTDLLTIDTSGSDYDTVVSVWTGTPGAFSASPIACNDDIDPGVARQSRLTFGVKAGTTYRILVSGYYGSDSGTLVFNMNSFNLGFSRLARNGAAGTGASTSPSSRPARPVRSAADIVVVAGQSKSLDLELTSSGNANEVISLECVGAPPGATCTVQPAQVTLNGASIPIQVKFDTGKTGASAVSVRAKRLSVNSRAATGSYELQVNARIGDVVRSTLVAATVTEPTPKRVKQDRN